MLTYNFISFHPCVPSHFPRNRASYHPGEISFLFVMHYTGRRRVEATSDFRELVLDGIGEEFLLKNPSSFSSACLKHSQEAK